MPTYLVNGQKVRFSSEPTEQDIDEAAQQLGLSSQTPEQPEMVGSIFGKVSREAYNRGERNVLGNVFERPGAAVRSALQGKGYTAGAVNPTNVPTFQDVMLKKLAPKTSSPLVNYIGGNLPSAIGMGMDIVTNPADLLSIVAGKAPGVQQAGRALASTRVGQRVVKTVSGVMNADIGKAVTTPIRAAKELLTSPKTLKQSLKNILFDIDQETRVMKEALTRTAELKGRVASKAATNLEKSYSDLANTLEYSAKKAGRQEALTIQKELPKHFSKRSSEYGARLKATLGNEGANVPAQSVADTMRDVLTEKGLFRFDPDQARFVVARSPKTPAEKKIYNAYRNINNLLESRPEGVIDAADIIRTNAVIKPKYGKKWTPDEYMQARLVEKLSLHIDDAVPGIKALKTEFRPYLKWKDNLIKRLKPFSTQENVGAAEKIISNVGTKDLSFDDRRMLGLLEKELKRKVGGRVKTLRAGQETANMRAASVKEQAVQELQQIKDLARQKAFEFETGREWTKKSVEEAINQVLQEYTKKRIIAGVIGGAVAFPLLQGTFARYFIRRELFEVLRGGQF